MQVWTLSGMSRNTPPWKAGRERGHVEALPLPPQAACGNAHALPQSHSGVQLSVCLSTHPSTILLNLRSPMKALPSCAGGGCRARASCSSARQDWRRIHRKPQPDPTSPEHFQPPLASSSKPSALFSRSGNSHWTQLEALHGAHCTIRCVPKTTAITPSDFGRQKVCAASRKLFLCPSQKSGVF